jgi:hypothetical protein
LYTFVHIFLIWPDFLKKEKINKFNLDIEKKERRSPTMEQDLAMEKEEASLAREKRNGGWEKFSRVRRDS